MSKVSINNLENIVLEGGGAKGAAYAGAIKGLEKVLKEHYVATTGDMVGGKEALLDFGKLDGDKLMPQIRRFAGSSAGAITSFALALGLSGKQIEEASKYPFTNFLTDLDPGKYRMVDDKGKACVGEDRGKHMGLGDGKVDYQFQLDARHKVKASWLKSLIRGQILGLVKNVLIAGVLQFFAKVQALYEQIANLINGTGGGGGFQLDTWGTISFYAKYVFNFFAKSGLVKAPTIANSPTQVLPASPPPHLGPEFELIATRIMNELIDLYFWKLKKDTKMNLGMEAVANLFWDGGMFSGFAVREFFFDLMVYACVNDTHFQRRYFPNEFDRDALNAVEMDMSKGRLEADFSKLNAGIQQRLRDMAHMTFEEFHALTDVSLTLCVSNFSTDEPVFFSEKTTPAFPVIEAVGASMTIPPAIKPVYNAADVWPYANGKPSLYGIDPKTLGKRRGKEEEYFDQMQYELDALAIRAFLAQEYDWPIAANNSMSFSGYMLLLFRYLDAHKDNTTLVEDVWINDAPVRITHDHLVFHYNAAFKGLLLDGGFRCNIPYNVYRNFIHGNPLVEEIDPMFDGTLAIKLDNTLPKAWVAAIYGLFQEMGGELEAKRFFRKQRRAFFGGFLKRNFKRARVKVLAGEAAELFEDEDLDDLNLASYGILAESVIEIYERMTKRHLNPWNKRKSILAVTTEGYSYGSESGQIRFLSDHGHIIPLYSYGIGTYDFDLDAISPLVELAKKKSEKAVEKYFL